MPETREYGPQRSDEIVSEPVPTGRFVPRWRYLILNTFAIRLGAIALPLAVVASGCGSAGNETAPEEGAAITASPTPANANPPGTVVRVNVTSDSVTPSGAQVDAAVGKPVTFVITATDAGEIHVHSTPEHMIAYQPGTSAATMTFKTPGVIDVESHTLDKLIVQLEVR